MYRIAVKRLEQIDRLLEEGDDFLLRRVRGITLGIQCADTCSMFAPLVLPEALVVPVDVFPVCVHVAQEARLPRRLQDLRDVCIGPCGVAVGVKRPIAVVRPEAVDGPVVRGTRRRRGIPELGLQQLAAGRIEAAGILHGGGILAGRLGVTAGRGAATEDALGRRKKSKGENGQSP